MSDDPIVPAQEAYEVRNEIIEKLMSQLASQIDSTLPQEWGFSLFLYQLHDEQEFTNIFYTSSLTVADALQLIQVWCNRQTQ